MSQRDVLPFLKKNAKKWLSPKDMSKYIKLNVNTISGNLRKLYFSGFLSRRARTMHQWEYKYGKGNDDDRRI